MNPLSPIVLKFGTGILAESNGCALDEEQFRRLAIEVSGLIKQGKPCILVTSAAIAAGVHSLKLAQRPADVAGKQACAAVGQPALMAFYERHFAVHGITTAQLLLTQEDISNSKRRHNAQVTLRHLLAFPNVLPIINENDSVTTEEISFGDNDQLSAAVAIMMQASLLILLTSTDGLIEKKGSRIPVVTNFEEALSHVTEEKGEHSTGGMKAKLKAVAAATSAGIETVVAHGRQANQLQKILAREDVGTRFLGVVE
ncbi:MAG: glutamate 5-kinase [Chthoniobacterales bacterium]|nr:glutamate 5-kinase [Chthoniobacterales bacterium]